jgi:hypothetical protein
MNYEQQDAYALSYKGGSLKSNLYPSAVIEEHERV